MVCDAWVMCGGPSADQKLSVSGDIIAVNKDAFRYYDSAKYTITMDNRFTIWELMNKQAVLPSHSTNIFVVNMADENIRHETSFCDKRWGISYNLKYYDMIIKSYQVNGFGDSFKSFCNGNNSGYCAIQLAIILGYKVIHLVGLDLCAVDGKTHHHGGYENSKDDFIGRCAEFEDGMRRAFVNSLSYRTDLKFINHSPISKLRNILGYEPIR